MTQRNLLEVDWTRIPAPADDGGRSESLHALDDPVGVRAIADQIPEHERTIVRPPGGISQAGLERFEVRVKIGKDEIAHRDQCRQVFCYACSQSTNCSTSASTLARPASRRRCACSYAARRAW